MYSVVLAHHPALQISSMASCVFYIPAFPSCALSLNKKTLTLCPGYHEMKFRSLLSFTSRRKICFLASSVLLGQGAAAESSGAVRAQSAGPGLSSGLLGILSILWPCQPCSAAPAGWGFSGNLWALELHWQGPACWREAAFPSKH